MRKIQEQAAERRRQAKKARLARTTTYVEYSDELKGANMFSFSKRMKMHTMVKEATEMVTKQKFATESELALEACFVRIFLRVSRCCALIAEAEWFAAWIILLIVVAGVISGVENTIFPAEGSPTADFLERLDLFVNVMFTIEVVLKIMAEGKEPWNYFSSNGNKFDFLVTVLAWPIFGDKDSSSLKVLRLFRLFRVLRLLSRFPSLAMIVNALITGLESIGFISFIMTLVFYLFAVLGVTLFQRNDPWHFGKLDRAMLSLFRIATFDDWTDIMYINILGCKNWGYSGDDSLPTSDMCDHSSRGGVAAAAFFIGFTILSAMVLLTLFVGVVSTSMNAAGEKARKRLKLEEAIDKYANFEKIPKGAVSRWRRVFTMLDLDESGTLDLDEIKVGFVELGVLERQYNLARLLSEMEQRGQIERSDELDTYQFVRFMVEFSRRSAQLAPNSDRAEKHYDGIRRQLQKS
mmetsp:Transcript_31317/g.91062  ORF Transcript_31317/g.91062 Transcript_31317/m.91062 type:complete len:464 (+) Transcript_31317:889-2280(+)